MSPLVTIDSLPESASKYQARPVATLDVIRATTTAVTAAARGHRVLVADTLERAGDLRRAVPDARLVGELGGNLPYGFDVHNSPALVDQLSDRRPIILLSTSGTRLMHEARVCSRVYVACLRNLEATAAAIARDGENVTAIGAGTRGVFRDEDQLACAWLAARLSERGFGLGDDLTRSLVDRWAGAPVTDIEGSPSAEYLTRTGQVADLDFVLTHVDDVDQAYVLADGEVIAAA